MLYVPRLFLFFLPKKMKEKNRFKSLCTPFPARNFRVACIDNARKWETQIGRRSGAICGFSEAHALTTVKKSSEKIKLSDQARVIPLNRCNPRTFGRRWQCYANEDCEKCGVLLKCLDKSWQCNFHRKTRGRKPS